MKLTNMKLTNKIKTQQKTMSTTILLAVGMAVVLALLLSGIIVRLDQAARAVRMRSAMAASVPWTMNSPLQQAAGAALSNVSCQGLPHSVTRNIFSSPLARRALEAGDGRWGPGALCQLHSIISSSDTKTLWRAQDQIALASAWYLRLGKRDAAVLELGAWRGGLSASLASTASAHGHRSHFTLVDTWDGSNPLDRSISMHEELRDLLRIMPGSAWGSKKDMAGAKRLMRRHGKKQRSTFVQDNAVDFLKETTDVYDLIIVDLCTVQESLEAVLAIQARGLLHERGAILMPDAFAHPAIRGKAIVQDQIQVLTWSALQELMESQATREEDTASETLASHVDSSTKTMQI